MLREAIFKARVGWLAALPCGLMVMGVQSARAGNYLDVVGSQTPLIYFEMNEPEPVPDAGIAPIAAAIDNLDAIFGPDQYINDSNAGSNILMGVPSMTPGGGFLGFDTGNTAFNFNTSGSGSVITHIFNPDPNNPSAPTGDPMGMVASSLSMWFNTTEPNLADQFVSGVLWRGDEGSGHNLNLRVINNVVTLNLEEGEFVTITNGTDGTIDYSDGQWHHVTATWEYDINTDAGMLNLYVDGGTLAGGEQVSTPFAKADYDPITFEPDPENNPGVFEVMDFDFRNRIGKGRINSHRFNGDIDEFASWNRVLSAQEIADQYNAAFEEGSALVGDLDGDGFVGIADLNIVLGNWNQNVTAGDPLQGDPSGDGFVGIEDLNEVLGNWNAGTPPANAVPEPATLALLSMGGLAMMRRRR